MNILKYKYKAHRMVNVLFYVVVFFIGFFSGFFTNKIGFDKLISNILMIDNVKAYTFYENEYYTVDEKFIYDAFFENTGNLYENIPYIICSFYDSLSCWAYTTNEGLKVTKVDSYGLVYSGYDVHLFPEVVLNIHIDGDKITKEIYKPNTSTDIRLNYGNSATNFDFIEGNNLDIVNANINKLDFNGINAEYNENLFKDNPDFKQVCVDKDKSYAITSTNIDPISNTLFASDFIWFPGKTTGIKYKEYDSQNDSNILVFGDDYQTDSFYFKDKDTIDSIYNDEISSNYFNHSGYTDKYSYLGYTAYKFIHSYYVDDNGFSQNMFTIFDFSKMNFSSFGSSGGSSSSFGDTSLNYCFYIKNEYNVTELQADEWNDYIGLVPTPGGDLEVNTSYNKDHASEDISLLFSNVNNFISEIKPTIDFINNYIHELYISMPLVVRMFILSLIVIIVIKILIGMVVN